MGNAPAARPRGSSSASPAALRRAPCRARPWSRAVAAVLLSTAALAAQARPNFLVVVVDDVGADAVAAYGAGALTAPTPTLDGLIASGVRFAEAHANPLCSPTRAALLTGRYAFRTGVAASLGPLAPGLDPAETTLPQALAANGYATALIGKWHLGWRYGLQTPNALGWQHFAGVVDGAVADYYSWYKVTNGAVSLCTTYATTQQVDDALAWIGAQTTPWLCSVAFLAAHTPLHAPPPHLHSQDLTGLDPARAPLPFFRAVVEAMDRELGRLLAGLPAAVRADTTIVVVGDNGTDPVVSYAATGSLRAKGTLYRRGTRVPLVVAGRGVSGPGRVATPPVGVVDVLPTLLELAGAALPPATAPRPLDGRSLAGVLAGATDRVRDHIYTEVAQSGFGSGYAVRTDRYALLRFLGDGRQRQELYDLVADPDERDDLLARLPEAQQTALSAPLEALLAAIRTDGWVAGFGAGCGAPALELRAETMPAPGQSLVVRVRDLPATAPFAIATAGWSRTTFGATALPLDLSPWSMAGCSLLVAPDLATAIDPARGVIVTPLPNLAALVGTRYYTQAFAVLPGAPAPTTTQALQVVIGD